MCGDWTLSNQMHMIMCEFHTSIATLTALRMESVTNQFPYWELQEASKEFNTSYRHKFPDGPELPKTEDGVGGKPVNVIIGMRYSKYFPSII